MSFYPRWRPYVPVARRKANAAGFATKLAKKEGRALAPVQIEGRKIAQSFWGEAWCDHLESHSDFENRLPRGRTYVRNGSVIDLQILNGQVKAIVSGSDVYRVSITIDTLHSSSWKKLKGECSQSIASLIDLLQGRFDKPIMERLIDRDAGLFPKPNEIKIKCSCPDWATLCKHAAAVLYGVGARLDASPELLFTLRGVDHLELIGQATAADNVTRALSGAADESLNGADLSEMFGIDIDPSESKPKRRRGVKPKKSGVTLSEAPSAKPRPAPVLETGRKKAANRKAATAKSTGKKAGKTVARAGAKAKAATAERIVKHRKAKTKLRSVAIRS